MKIESGFLALGILLASLVAAGPGLAATGAASPGATITVAEGQAVPVPEDQPPAIRPMTGLEKISAGCLVSGGGALAATYLAGPSELVMLLMGGLVVPSSSSVLFISLIGTMTSVACGAGLAAEPLVEWAWGRVTFSGQEASAVGSQIGTGLAQLGSGVSHAFASVTGGVPQVAEMAKPAQ